MTDPPYGLAFMGKDWDDFNDGPGYRRFSKAWALEAFRVLKPGGHLIAFSGTRTYHWMAVGIEQAGFEVRDMLQWLYGSGFPKSHNIGKAIEGIKNGTGSRFSANHKGLKRGDRVSKPGKQWQESGNRTMKKGDGAWTGESIVVRDKTSKQWAGWGTALKPAQEPIILARKPVSEGNVAANVLKHGTGAMNIDKSRVPLAKDDDLAESNPNTKGGFGHKGAAIYGSSKGAPVYDPSKGRWPANVIHDGSIEVTRHFPANGSGITVQRNGGGQKIGGKGIYQGSKGLTRVDVGYDDEGNVSRFFYCAKASKAERNLGINGKEQPFVMSNSRRSQLKRGDLSRKPKDLDFNQISQRNNSHPTVKPIALMRYLVNLVTPSGGVVLDPFLGSGTTGIAACLSGCFFVGIEKHKPYMKIARQRILNWRLHRTDAEPIKAASFRDLIRKS